MAIGENEKRAPQTHPVIEKDGQLQTYAYGCYWPVMNDIQLELTCFRLDHRPEKGGLGSFRHLMKAHNLVWPHMAPSINEWVVARFKEFCKPQNKIITLAGGSGTGKSSDAARFALLWWWSLPQERTVLLFSTTVGALMKRAWKYIIDGYSEAHGDMPGKITNSPPPKMMFSKMDTLHGIHGLALRQGNADKTLAEVIGIHPKEGLLVLCDEHSDALPAVNDAITNWDSGGVAFKFIGIANAKSKLDPHGRLSEPVKGWESINPDEDEMWETTSGGVCLYFDCYKSPAIKRPNFKPIQYLITADKIKNEEKRLGKDDPKFWRFVRGFWAPEDATKTVLTLSMIDKHRARKEAEFAGHGTVTIAALDPAFTADGDECILRFGTLGLSTEGFMVLDTGGPDNVIKIQLDSKSKEPISYQIVHAARRECSKRGVTPSRFGADTWGFGLGAGDIFEKEWSPDIIRVVSAGSPSNEFVDSDLTEHARDAFYDRITELWFNIKNFVMAEQIRGLDIPTIEQLVSRTYEWKGRKLYLERKKAYKRRIGKDGASTGSPDEADAMAILVHVAKENGFALNSHLSPSENKEDWQRMWEEERNQEEVEPLIEDWSGSAFDDDSFL